MVGKLQKEMLYWHYLTLTNFLKGKVDKHGKFTVRSVDGFLIVTEQRN